MVAGITIRANGMAEHAYRGQVGWTGLGNELLETDTLEDQARKSGMDWTIQSAVVRYATGHGQDSNMWRSMPSKIVLHRSDNFEPLGIVSDTYQKVQPIEILEFFHGLARDNGFQLETAGTLFGGKRFWGLAKIGPDSYVAESSDKIKAYLLLVTSADGTLATEGRFVVTRVVCNNTLQMALGESSGTRVKVSHRSTFSEHDMKQKLGVVAADAFESTMDNLRKLANTRVSHDQMARDTVELFYPGTFDKDGNLTVDSGKWEKQLRSAPVQRVANMAITGRDLIGADKRGMNGTAYGWLNAVTQYTDHEARTQKGPQESDNRTNSALFGKGATQKVRALQMAMTHADGSVSYVETEEAESVSEALPDFSRLLGGNGAPPAMGGGDDFASLLNRPRG